LVCENDLQPVIVLSASYQAVLVAAIYAVPEPDLGATEKE